MNESNKYKFKNTAELGVVLRAVHVEMTPSYDLDTAALMVEASANGYYFLTSTSDPKEMIWPNGNGWAVEEFLFVHNGLLKIREAGWVDFMQEVDDKVAKNIAEARNLRSLKRSLNNALHGVK